MINRHPNPPLIGRSYSALADFSYNPAVGCVIGCRHCSITHGISKHSGALLQFHGINDPELSHGKYLLVREFDQNEFLRSLIAADEACFQDGENKRPGILLVSSTADPYLRLPDLRRSDARKFQAVFDQAVEHALIHVLQDSSLNVRILTRSTYARRHFELFAAFGARLQFGMSLPTLNEELSHIYEPGAASPKERLKLLRAAKRAGLNCFVAMSPTYPECDENDLRRTLSAIAELNPVTIFYEPINIRGRNLERLPEESRAAMKNWAAYALRQFQDVHRIASELGIVDRLHFMPDASLRDADPQWFDYWRSRRPAWPSDAP